MYSKSMDYFFVFGHDFLHVCASPRLWCIAIGKNWPWIFRSPSMVFSPAFLEGPKTYPASQLSVSGRHRSPPGPLPRSFRRNGEPVPEPRNGRSSKAMAGTRRMCWDKSVGWVVATHIFVYFPPRKFGEDSHFLFLPLSLGKMNPFLTFAYFSKGLVQPSTSWLRNPGGKGRWWSKKTGGCLNVMEFIFCFLFGEERIDSKNLLTKVLTQLIYIFFSDFYQFYVIKKQIYTYTKKTHILTSKSFTMRGASDSCMGLAWRWCGASVFCGRRKNGRNGRNATTQQFLPGW